MLDRRLVISFALATSVAAAQLAASSVSARWSAEGDDAAVVAATEAPQAPTSTH